MPTSNTASGGTGATAIEDRVPYGPPPDPPLPGAPAGESPIPRRKALWFTLASATALVVLAPTAGQVYGWMFAQIAESSWSAAHPITALRVEVDSGDVQIGPGAAGEVNIGESLKWALHEPSVREVWHGDSLVVTASCGGSSLPLPSECSTVLDIRVPATVPVTVATTSGSVFASGMSGGLDARTDSGDIQLNGVGGTVSAHAISGSVFGRGLTAPDANVQAESGDVDLEFTAPPQRVVSRVVSGETLVVVPRGDGYLITGQTASGRREVDPVLENGEATRSLAVDSGSGDVAIHVQG